MHHKHKVDAPSGTALRLGEAAAAGAGTNLADTRSTRAKAITGERKPGRSASRRCAAATSSASTRCSSPGAGERIELTHRATSRQNFAAGALRAARFVARAQRKPGLYDMRDVLGLR